MKGVKAAPITAKAYSIVNQLQAPDLMGACEASDKHKAIACQSVSNHWAVHAQGAMMPSDLREIIDYWISRYDEVVTDA
jgi:hypothetical protein